MPASWRHLARRAPCLPLRWTSAHRCVSTEAAPVNAWNFPCPICGQMKAGHVLACSDKCLTTLATLHPQTHAELLTLKDDIACAQSSDVRALFHKLAKHTPSPTVTTWTDLLHDVGASPSLLNDPAVLRLVSASYSYVMTLRHYLPDLLPDTTTLPRPSVYIVGARAEATMPRHFWTMLHPYQWNVAMIGNHVPVLRAKPPSDDAIHISYHNGLFHDLTLPSPDAFVLFNPGLGHPNLRTLWAPTLATMLQTRRSMLLTAFSAEDLARDVAVLTASHASMATPVTFHENPFGSAKCTVDPLHLLSPVHTNRFACVIQSAH
ncbi:Aste57867_20627 [Aphanomyces stellatus]|uniref:Aste57867_20627 protein n=1 Tax=Aphanomyces stellatus TaxID=120398 RepID=A0A485LGN3_9STRA|nr:hypothetical protein As57867_020559 [Aphanomyces stellatus]VFT97307.1 Aste57867_20627 [Aphanomyces stellatus]